MEIPGPLLLLTHFLLGTLGYFTGWYVARRSVSASREDKPMRVASHSVTRGTVVTASTVAFVLVVLGIAIQTWLWQRDVAAHDRCVNQWGQDLIATNDRRSNASFGQQRAQSRRSTTLDDLLLFAIANPAEERTPAQERLLDGQVKRYTRAVADLRKKEAVNAKTRKDYPFPELDC